MNSKLNNVLIAAAAGLSLLAASCGGGSSAPIPGPGGPAAGTADLSGRLLEGSGGRAASTVGDGLGGIPVTLINSITGALRGSDVTSASGGFEFKAVPSGSSYLVKVEFTAARDLNGDGSNDQVELYFPVSMADQSITELIQTISLDDSTGDGSDDSVLVRTELSDDRGLHRDSTHQHRFRSGETRVDDNSDGSFERSFDDSDCDGLPDTSFSGGQMSGNSGLHELEVKGRIEALSSSSITVSGTEFALTGTTTWRIDDNRNASPSQFAVGDFVEVEGFANGSGGWVAFKVKTEDDFGPGGGTGGGTGGNPGVGDELELRGLIESIDADSVTVGGTAFAITSSTTWRIGDNRNASPSQFAVGMFVEITGDLASGGVWNARKVKIEDDLVSGGGDDNGGGSDDDDDDNSGSGKDDDDDDDDNSGSVKDDDDDDDDNSGSGKDDDDDDDDDEDDDSGNDDSGSDGGGDDGTPDQGSGDN